MDVEHRTCEETRDGDDGDLLARLCVRRLRDCVRDEDLGELLSANVTKERHRDTDNANTHTPHNTGPDLSAINQGQGVRTEDTVRRTSCMGAMSICVTVVCDVLVLCCIV